MTELYDERVEIDRELEQAEKDLAAAQAEYDEAIEALGGYTDGMSTKLSECVQVLGDCQSRVNALTAAQQANTDETAALEGKYNELATAASKVSARTRDAAASAEEAAGKFFDLGTMLKETEEDLKLLIKAQNEMADSSYLSLDTVQKLISSGYDGYLEEVERGYRLTEGTLEDYIAAQRTEYELVYNEAESAASAIPLPSPAPRDTIRPPATRNRS